MTQVVVGLLLALAVGGVGVAVVFIDRVTRFTYDAQGQGHLHDGRRGERADQISDPLGNIIRVAYDAHGNLTSIGKVTTIASNAFGQPLTSGFALSLEGGAFLSCTAASGYTSLRKMLQNKTVQVSFHVVRVKKADPGFTLDPESYSEVSLIQRMSISVDGRSVVVPRSAFTDLFNVRKAWLIVEKGSFVLSVGGADGADLYLARTYFDSRVVHRRAVDACALDMFSKLPFVY